MNQDVQIASAARNRSKASTNPYVGQSKAGAGSETNIQTMVNDYINRNTRKRVSTDHKKTSFEMEFGRYHPTTGIPLYSIDFDFDFEEEFEIRVRKVPLARGSSGA